MAEQQNSFQLLKEKLISALVLNYPDFQQEFLVTKTHPITPFGAVLSQGPKICKHNLMQSGAKL